MRFFLSRTSRPDARPCEEAVQGTYIQQDWRSVDDPRKINAYKHRPDEAMKMWYEEGTNHRVEHGMIVRDMGERKAWFIEIDTLEQLMTLYKKYGNLVIKEKFRADETEIEIYDDYRE